MVKRTGYGIIAVVMVLLFSSMALGAGNIPRNDWRNNWQSIKTAISHIQSVKASFVQEKHMKILIKPLVSKGVFFFQKPDSLRWEYLTPIRSVLVFHNASVQYFFMGSHGLTKTAGSGIQAMEVWLQEMANWLNGRFDENPAFDMRLIPGSKKIILTAKDPSIGRFVRKIEIYLARQPGGIKSVWIYESKDSYTRLIFKNLTFNDNLKPDLFTNVK